MQPYTSYIPTCMRETEIKREREREREKERERDVFDGYLTHYGWVDNKYNEAQNFDVGELRRTSSSSSERDKRRSPHVAVVLLVYGRREKRRRLYILAYGLHTSI